MRIALVKRRYSLRHGGSERYCVNLARRLTALGHDVTVVGERIDEELAGEVEFVAVPVNRATSWTNNRSFAENCGAAVANRRFDVVYGLGRMLGLDAVRVTERLQSHWVNVRYRQPWFQRLQRRNPRHRTMIDLERRIYESEDVRRIVTQSQLDRRLVQEYYDVPEEKLRTIYNGVDTTMFHPGVRAARDDVRKTWGISRDVPLLLFASMDFPGKGLGSILKALVAVRDVHLLVLGSGPVKRYRRLATRLGVGNRVVFAGRQCGIERYYGAADLFLLPTAYEPFANVNLEAMACGSPVVTTTTHGSAEFVHPGETGYLLSCIHAVDEIAAHIAAHFSQSDDDRRRMALRCRETAEQLPFERNVRETLAVFEEVREEKRRGQRSVVGSQRSEVRSQKSEVGSQRSEVGEFQPPSVADSGQQSKNNGRTAIWDGGRLTVNVDFAATLQDAGLTTFAAWMQTDRGEVAKNLLAERKTFRIDLPADAGTQPFFLKRMSRPPMKEYVKPWLRLTRPLLGARNEWNAILEFQRAGIPTMTPVAIGEDGGESFLLTKAVEGCVKLSDWAESRFGAGSSDRAGSADYLGEPQQDDAELCEVVDGVAELARRMHAARLHHQDFYLAHLLLPVDDPARGIHVIDLGRARKLPRLSSRWIVKDLGQLLYSARMFPGWAEDRLLAGYFGREPSGSLRPLVRRIRGKAARIARHSEKHRL